MPINKILEEKKVVVSGLVDKIKDAQSFVLADYRGLTVEQDTELRNALRTAGVEYKVVKNTLTKLALKELGIEGLDEHLAGPTAIALSSSDVVAPAKVMAEYAKKFEKLDLKAGAIEGKAADVKDIEYLASIPSKEILLTQLLYALTGNLRGLAVALNAVKEKNEDGSAAEAAPSEEA